MFMMKKPLRLAMIIAATAATALFVVMGPTRFVRLIAGGHAGVRESVTQSMSDNLLLKEMQCGIADTLVRESKFAAELVLHEEELNETQKQIEQLNDSIQAQRGYLEQSERAMSGGSAVVINGQRYDAATVRRDGAQRLSRFNKDRAELNSMTTKRERLQAAIAQGQEQLESFRAKRQQAQHELDMLAMELQQGRMLAEVANSVDNIRSSGIVLDAEYGEAMQELRRRVAFTKARLEVHPTAAPVDYQGDAARHEDVLVQIRTTLAE